MRPKREKRMLSYDKSLERVRIEGKKGTLPPKEAFSLIDNLEGKFQGIKEVAETCVGASGNGCQWQWRKNVSHCIPAS